MVINNHIIRYFKGFICWILRLTGGEVEWETIVTIGLTYLVANSLYIGISEYLSAKAHREFLSAEKRRATWEFKHFREAEVNHVSLMCCFFVLILCHRLNSVCSCLLSIVSYLSQFNSQFVYFSSILVVVSLIKVEHVLRFPYFSLYHFSPQMIASLESKGMARKDAEVVAQKLALYENIFVNQMVSGVCVCDLWCYLWFVQMLSEVCVTIDFVCLFCLETVCAVDQMKKIVHFWSCFDCWSSVFFSLSCLLFHT